MFQHTKTPTSRTSFQLANVQPVKDYSKINANSRLTKMSNSDNTAVIPLNIQETKFTRAYFSPQNVKIIQDQLRYGVYILSKGRYTVDPQPVSELMVIMESNFKQFSRNPTDNSPDETIRNEIARLNKAVLDYCIPEVLSSANARENYLYKITNNVVPMKPAEYVGTKKSDARNQVSYQPWDNKTDAKSILPSLI